MLHQPTIEKLEAMRLHGMAQAWRELSHSEQAAELSFEDRMALLVGGPAVPRALRIRF